MNWCEQLITEINWQELTHAYGPADDLPEQLRTLIGPSEAWGEAAHHLWEATTHQGRVFDSTPPVVRFLARWLAERAEGDWDEAATYIALMCLHDAGQAARVLGTVAPALGACAPEVLEALTPLALQPSHPADGIIGAALIPWVAVAETHPQAVQLTAQLRTVLEDEQATREWRGLVVLGLGELGQDVSRFLDDPDPAIRTCAALTNTGEKAAGVLQQTATLGEVADEWFTWTVSFRLIHGVALACELELQERQG
ncbi:MAG: hypothetical protein Q4D96_07450 [Propionibacteriaceae bacterium]|nr:hypothetical protein [Propionibacteriaceae bacterium]